MALTRGHVLGAFLELNHLLVGESGPIVNQAEGVVGVAVGAERRLGNASALHLNRGSKLADRALEQSLRHLRDQRRGPDNHAGDRDQLVNVWKR